MMTSEDLARANWQGTPKDAEIPSLESLRASADAFGRKIRRRNAVEYGAGVLVIVIFALYALFLPTWSIRIGSLLVILGTVHVMWQLHRRTAPDALPGDAGTMSVLAFRRRELERQRDALASIVRWYLAPIVPGLAVIMIGPMFEIRPGSVQVPDGALAALAGVAGVFVAIWWLNRQAAGKLQTEIDEIDALTAD